MPRVLLKSVMLFAVVLSQLAAPVIAEEPKTDDLIIWAKGGAGNKWDQAYPVGNGRLGAMPFGNFPHEKLLINEETIWAKGDKILLSKGSLKNLNKMVALEAKGDFKGVDTVFHNDVFKQSQRPDSYQLLGWLKIEYLDAVDLQDSQRSLDLKTGIVRSVHTLKDGTVITQTVLASAVDDVVAISIKATKPVSFRVSMDGAVVKDGDLIHVGAADGKGTKHIAHVRALPADKLQIQDGKVTIADSRDSVIYLSAATDFNRRDSADRLLTGWQDKPAMALKALAGKSYAAVKQDAIADHQKYFNRQAIDFGTTAPEILRLPTEERLDRIKQGMRDDPDLIEAYVQFGRYLLIASSRPGTLPANLQGIWNPHLDAPWKSDYHLNINIQMNYWLAETANLSELHTPFFDLIRSFQKSGKDNAKRMGMKGWAMGHSTDVWGHARPMGMKPNHSGTFFGGQWMTFHILEHYRFNRDVKFLQDNWDILTASTQFVDAWLIDAPQEGKLMARPAASPENPFIYIDASGKKQRAALSAGTSFDQFMILQVFSDYLEAARALGKMDDAYVQKIKALVPRVLKPKIGQDGRLQEWRLPFEETDAAHRHISHVIGAFPGNQINLDDDGDMRSAVLKTLETRLKNGGAKTGWSRAWTIGMFARLSDQKNAYENLIAILERSTLPNLWDNHPPFQIDGNFGATAAVMEMLLHSHNNEIKLLPALPQAWPNGYIQGIRARGNYTLDISWQDGKLDAVTLIAGDRISTDNVRVIYGDQTKQINLAAGQKITLTAKDFRP